MTNNTPKWEETLKDLPRKTINGCWYVELGSIENIIKNEILPQARAEMTSEIVKVINETEVFYGNPRAEKMMYYDDVLKILSTLKHE